MAVQIGGDVNRWPTSRVRSPTPAEATACAAVAPVVEAAAASAAAAVRAALRPPWRFIIRGHGGGGGSVDGACEGAGHIYGRHGRAVQP